jgi:hypothetical protein
MGKALHCWANSQNVLATATEAFVSSGGVASTEADAQAQFRHAGTFRNLGRVNLGGNGTNTIRLRVAGGNGNLVTSAAGTGWLADDTNSDTIAANTLVNYAFTDTGSSPTYGVVKVVFAASGDHCAYLASGGPAVICDAASETRFLRFAGEIVADGEATRANCQFKARPGGTMRAFQVNISANARTNNSVFASDIAGASGNSSITFAAGVTGLVVEDDAVTDTIADGALYCASITLDTGVEDLAVRIVACAITNASVAKSELALKVSVARAASATAHYLPLGGWAGAAIAETTETDVALKPGFAGTGSRLRVYLSANTYTVDAQLTFRVAGVDRITTTLTASGGAGWYENTTDSFAFVETDDLSYKIVGGTSGSITIENIMVTIEDNTAALFPRPPEQYRHIPTEMVAY